MEDKEKRIRFSFLRGMKKDTWQAVWITPEEKTEPEIRKGAGYLKKRFTLPEDLFRADTAGESPKLPEQALLFATSHGLYDLRLNGAAITDARLTPGCDEYTERLQYQCYDVAPFLRPGENELFVTLGDGWYRGNNGIDGVRNLFGDDLSFLAELVLGDRVLLKTDESFGASTDGPITLTDLELGETYDARKEMTWHRARKLSFSYDRLVPTETVKVSAHEAFSGKPFYTPDGSLVYDFGQNLAGYTELNITGAKAGQKVRLIHGETLDENGNFTIANFQPGDRNKNGGIPQEVNYICREGDQSYAPLFSIFGFRYVKVETEIPQEKLTLTARALYSDMAETAKFSCGSPLVDRLFQNAVWSMKSNFVDIPTDCPTRERAGWTGDAAIFADTGSYLMDCVPVYRKWLQNLRLKQYPNGRMAFIAPSNGKPGLIAKLFSASVGWGDAAVIVPWELYKKTGDLTLLAENYEMMKGWVGFLEKRARKSKLKNRFKKNPYRRYTIDTGMDYGEWNEPGVNMMETMKNAAKNGQPEVATAYLAYSSGLLAKIAALLKQEEDERHFLRLHENAVKAYHYLQLPDGHIHSGRQCEYVRPIALGLLTEEEARQAAADLNALVTENSFRLNTGFLSTAHLLPVLAEHGYTETAYRLLLNEDCPGWLYAVKKGATTVWETWDGIRKDGTVHDSLNHYSYGAVAGFLVKYVLGIRYCFDRVELKPCPHALLQHAEGCYHTPRGTIRASWAFAEAENAFHYTFEIPEGMEAFLTLPDGREEMLKGGTYSF